MFVRTARWLVLRVVVCAAIPPDCVLHCVAFLPELQSKSSKTISTQFSSTIDLVNLAPNLLFDQATGLGPDSNSIAASMGASIGALLNASDRALPLNFKPGKLANGFRSFFPP